MGMETLYQDLAGLLRQEIEQYRRLHALTGRERGRIVKGELGGLSKIVREKEAVVQRLGHLEESRKSLLERMAGELGEPLADLTLNRVARLAPGRIGQALAALLDEFRAVIGRLVAADEVNRTLLERSLGCVQGSLALFHSVAGAGGTYGAGGRIEVGSPALVELNQTA